MSVDAMTRTRLLVLGLLCALPAACAGTSPQRYEFTTPCMGTEFRLVLYAAGVDAAREAAEEAFARVRGLERVLSDYDPDSEVRRLCARAAAGPSGPVPISRDLCRVLERGLYWSRQSGGAFDVTVGPFVRLWRRSARQGAAPTGAALASAARAVGYQHLDVDPLAGTACLRVAGMRLDFGAIGKGDAADEALEVLRARGIQAALMDAGGDLVAMGAPPGRAGWSVAVDADPTRPDSPSTRLALRDQAIATSGDAWQFVELQGVRHSHVVDPGTGLGVVGRVAASVIAPRGADADAAASALCVMDPERGLAWVETLPGVEARIVVIGEDGALVRQSRGWPVAGQEDPGLATARRPQR